MKKILIYFPFFLQLDGLVNRVTSCFTEDVADAERCVSSVLNESALQEVERNIKQDVEQIQSKYSAMQ